MQRLVIIESGFDHPKLRRVRDHITRHISESYRLERAADIASASPKYLCELFRKHVGVSFGVWLWAFRMERAKVLLMNNRWQRIGAVARAVGYYDPTTFGRAFKRYEGITPRQFVNSLSNFPRAEAHAGLNRVKTKYERCDIPFPRSVA